MMVNDRFWSKVKIKGPDDCWEWQAHRMQSGGYGQFGINGKLVRAHRFSYELLIGQIPKSLILMHLCGNPSCVNPKHLKPGTHKQNAIRGKDHYCSKLSTEERKEIRRLYTSTYLSKADLAERYGISKSAVHYWVKNLNHRVYPKKPTKPKTKNLPASFISKIRKDKISGCWLWTRSLNIHGYSKFWHRGYLWSGHRFAYHSCYRPIPKDMWVLHKCNNRKCVNPEHLFLGTAKTNMLDTIRKGRRLFVAAGAKVNERDVVAIRKLHEKGELQTQIARRYGISTSTTHDIIYHRAWKHVK